MKIKLLPWFMLFMVNICYASDVKTYDKNNSNLILSIEIDRNYHNVTLMVENISKNDMIIVDPFGYTQKELAYKKMVILFLSKKYKNLILLVLSFM